MTQEQWQAILSRDLAYDDQFCYVFLPSSSICRPSCRMHKPKPNRIAVFQNAAQAIAEGYRPCTRCRPDIPGWQGTQRAMADAARQYLQDHSVDIGEGFEPFSNRLRKLECQPCAQYERYQRYCLGDESFPETLHQGRYTADQDYYVDDVHLQSIGKKTGNDYLCLFECKIRKKK